MYAELFRQLTVKDIKNLCDIYLRTLQDCEGENDYTDRILKRIIRISKDLKNMKEKE